MRDEEAGMSRSVLAGPGMRIALFLPAVVLFASCNLSSSNPILGGGSEAAATGTPAGVAARDDGADLENAAECPDLQHEKTMQLVHNHTGMFVNSKGQRFDMVIEGTQLVRIVAATATEQPDDDDSGIHELSVGPLTATQTVSQVKDCPAGSNTMTIVSKVKGACVGGKLTLYVTLTAPDLKNVTLECKIGDAVFPFFIINNVTTVVDIPVANVGIKPVQMESDQVIWFGGKLFMDFELRWV
jgi:hypothetical protein